MEIAPARTPWIRPRAGERRDAGEELMMTTSTPPIRPFRAAIPDDDIADLQQRLARTRWPHAETVDDWSQGVRLESARALVETWARDYDWRRFERELNTFPQFLTEIDGVDVHFIHVRSPHAGALPLVLTHGWPGSNADYLRLIGPLTDPVAFGGDAADSFDVIIPSMPGFGFSGKPSDTGWSVERTARAWVELVRRLGYERWTAQGGDWGGMVTLTLGAMEPDGLLGIHVHSAYAFPAEPPDDPTPEERAALAGLARYANELGGSNHLQATKPETVGIALADSPAGQAAWIYEKYQSKTDNTGRAEDAISVGDMLDVITLAWFTNTAASSGRIYWENRTVGATGPAVQLPVAVTLFPRDLPRPTRGWVELAYPNLVHCNEAERGGHFAALEQPGTLVDEIRTGLRGLRASG